MGFQESNSRRAALAAAPGVNIDAGVECNPPLSSARGGLDISAQVFGRLTALRPSDRSLYWWFRCTCGTEREILKANVKSGTTKSCGCLLAERRGVGSVNGRAHLDFTGEKFGALTAIRYVGSGKRGARWLFRCDCGTELELTAKDVRYGHRKSCGCMRHGAWASPVSRDRGEAPSPPKSRNDFPVRGLSPEELAHIAEWYGVDGHAASLIAFACEMQRAVSRAAEVPAALVAGSIQ